MKIPPYDIGSEQSVLGGMIMRNDLIPEVVERISADDFYRQDHQEIFREIVRMSGLRKAVDFMTLCASFRAAGSLADVGGEAYIGTIANDTPSAHNTLHYAETVRERAISRRLIAIGAELVDGGYSGESHRDVLEAAEKRLFEVRQADDKRRGGPVDLAILADLAERGIELREKSGGGITGLPTGITELDRLTTGLHPGDLVVIGGRPSSGKTSLGLGIAEHCSFIIGKPSLIFSMEMPGEQVALRFISSWNRIPLQALRSGEVTRDDWDRIGSRGLELKEAPVRIDEGSALTPNDIRARARREASRGSLGLIVIDYVQLMSCPGSENRTNEVSEISRSMKALAKELHVPIVMLSQLNRGVENRENKRPRMADLRESGGIEQDADLIAFIYRDEVYNKNSPFAGTAEILVEKQRNGPLGMVRTAFLGEFCRFENLAPGWTQPQIEQPARKKVGFRGMSHAAHSVGREAA